MIVAARSMLALTSTDAATLADPVPPVNAAVPRCPRVPDAVQRVAAQISLRNLRKLDCAAERCTADPGPPRNGITISEGPGVCSAPLRCATCCAAPGTRGRKTERKALGAGYIKNVLLSAF